MAQYQVIVIGDAILDEYVYISPLGMSNKDMNLTAEFKRKEIFQGGVYGAAAHLENFVSDVQIHAGNVITTKRRFVEETYVRKFFTLYVTESVGQAWEPDFTTPDMVIVTDFGHGCVDAAMIKRLGYAKYLAVNAQTNSANRGFNLITKYPRADYVVIDNLEARLAAHDKDSPIEDVIGKLGFPKIVVTQGANGAVGYDWSFHYAKGRGGKVVDTMGAGDAFFAVTAPLAGAGADMPTLLEVGNAAGAIKCGSVGQKAVTKEALLEAVCA